MSKLSIIVPVYNVGKYLPKCIESVLHQTYQDWELILVDDGSVDHTAAVCKEYRNRDSRIKYFYQDNSGVSAARNLGLLKATGDYITFIDGDDWIEDRMLQSMMAHTTRDEYDIIIGGYIDDEDGQCSLEFKGAPEQILNRESTKKNFFSHDLFMWTVYDKIFRKNILSHTVFDEQLAIGEDQLFIWEIIKRMDSAYYIPLYQYHYCHRNDGAIRSVFSEKNIGALQLQKRILDEIPSEEKYLKRLARTSYLGTCVGTFRKILHDCDDRDIEKIQWARDIQKIVRRKFYYMFFFMHMNVLSSRQRLGFLYVILPLRLCRALRKIVRKNYE